MAERPIRVLQVIADFKKGGVQAEVMWPARLISRDEVRFDALMLSDTVGYYEEEFRQYGNIYRIVKPAHRSRIIRALSTFTGYAWYRCEVEKLLRTLPQYDAIHVHHITHNAPVLAAAKKVGIPVRIAHCAVNKPEGAFRDRLYYRFYLWLCSLSLARCATERLGVTQNAADYVFGKGKGRPIKNPTLDLTRFDPSLYTREDPDTLTLIMVGSFSSRKNQSFAVDILKELRDAEVQSRLILIGYPRSPKEDYLPRLKQKVNDLGLDECVSFLPQDSDIPYHMAQSDFMLIPSLQEGLPNVALEAQAMGLPCILSDKVSDDCDCGLCSFLPLDRGAAYWSNIIEEKFRVNKGKKTLVDMSTWDNRAVCKEYIEMWKGI